MNIINDPKIRLFNGVLQYSNPINIDWQNLNNTIVVETTGFNLRVDHINKYVRVNSDTDVIVNINSDIFPLGSSVVFEQTGVGTITITSNVNTVNGDPVSMGQYKCLQIIKVSTNEWTVLGGTAILGD